MTPKKSMLLTYLIKFVVLLIISLILAAGFWFHREFYQYGFITLVSVGGFVTFLIIIVTSKTLSLKLIRNPRPKIKLEFTKKEKSDILDGSKKAIIVPISTRGLPGLHDLCSAVFDDERFAILHITDIRRSLITDLNDPELLPSGFKDAAEFKRHWSKDHEYRPYDVVNILFFDSEPVPGSD